MIRHGIFFHDETYLVSFPRSGANWLRYCVEVITKQATFGVKPAARGHNALTPLDNSVEFAVKKILNEELIDGAEINQKPILQHSHLWLAGYSSTDKRIRSFYSTFSQILSARALEGVLIGVLALEGVPLGFFLLGVLIVFDIYINIYIIN